MQSKCTIHSCRFVDWKPESITCLAFDPEGEKLAVGRGNGDIEIWNVVSSFLCDQVIAGSSAAVLNALSWAPRTTAFTESRLFSAGFSPQIVEWDLVTLRPKNSCDTYGGVVWALQVDPTGTQLAVGCDDGCVRLFSIDSSDGSIQFTKSFDRVHGRMLSVAWDPVGLGIMGGSSDGSVRRWNVETNATEYRIRMDRQQREDKAPVWTLLALRDGTLVSGTSAGLVQFWDAKMGTLCKSFKGHSADVLALAANQSQTLVFSGGVDGQVLQYSLSAPDSPVTDADRWVFSAKRRLHTHDVRALSCLGNYLASGGLDTILFVSKVDMFTELPPRNILPLPHSPLASLARPSKLLLVQAPSSLHVWSLSSGLEASGRNGMVSNGLHVVSPEHPRLLAQINIKAENNLRCSAISPNGAFIACSTTSELKLFRLSQPTTTPSLFPTDAPLHVRKTELPQKLGGAARLLFTPDSKRLVVGALDGRIHVVDVEESTLLRSFPHHQARHAIAMQRESGSGPGKVGSLWSLAVSPDGQWLASGDSANNIHVFHLDSLQHHSRVPSVETSHTALCFHADNRTLAIVSCTRHIYLYDVDLHQLQHWTRGHHQELPWNFWKHTGHVASATFHPTRPDLLLMVSQKWFCTINLDLHPSLAQPLLLEQGNDQSDASSSKRFPKRRKAINPDIGTPTPASETRAPSEGAGPSATAKGKQRATVGDVNRTSIGPKPVANGTCHAESDSDSDSDPEPGDCTGSKASANAVGAGGKKRRKGRGRRGRGSVHTPAPLTPSPDDGRTPRRSATATLSAPSSKRKRASKAAADTEGTAVDKGAEGGGDDISGGGSQGRNLMFNRPPLLFVDFLGPSDLFVMERPWEEVVAQLPPALSTHRFGT